MFSVTTGNLRIFERDGVLIMRKLKIPGYVFYEQFEYCDYKRFTVDGIKGTLYRLCKPLTPDQDNIILKYSNVRLFVGRSEYAPEQRRQYLFIGNKCFTERTV